MTQQRIPRTAPVALASMVVAMAVPLTWGATPSGPPRIQSATVVDVNNDGLLTLGDQLVLTLTRSANVTTSALKASHFFLPVEGDTLGGAGFEVDVNPFNSRQIAIRLGTGTHLEPFGEFVPGATVPGSPSAVDFASSLPVGAILSLDGLSAEDGGVPGVDDTGVDIQQSLLGLQVDLDPVLGGSVAVVPSPDTAYTRHKLDVPPGALASLTTFRTQPPPINLGVVDAFWIESSSPTMLFQTPATVTAEFREGDVDVERGQLVKAMRVHQLVEIPGVGFEYVLVPGQHTVAKSPQKGKAGKAQTDGDGAPQKLQSTSGTVSVQVNNLNPGGSPGPPGLFAGIPVDTVDERTIHIKPSGGGIVKQAGAILAPGPRGLYTLHKIEFPGYIETTSSDPQRLTMTIRTALLAEKVSTTGGQSFPSQSGAVFVLEAEDASAQPVAFTDAVNLTVQFIADVNPNNTDTVRFDGFVGMPGSMRLVYDQAVGASVDFAFVNLSPQTVDTGQGTVTVNNLTGLTGSDGKGAFGAVIADPAEIEAWKKY